MLCPDGDHPCLLIKTPRDGFRCEGKCEVRFPKGSELYGCRKCNYDICPGCITNSIGHNLKYPKTPDNFEDLFQVTLELSKLAKSKYLDASQVLDFFQFYVIGKDRVKP